MLNNRFSTFVGLALAASSMTSPMTDDGIPIAMPEVGSRRERRSGLRSGNNRAIPNHAKQKARRKMAAKSRKQQRTSRR